MKPLQVVVGEYLVHLKHLTNARAAWKQEPTRNNLIRYLSALNASTERRQTADIIRTIEFPDQRKTA